MYPELAYAIACIKEIKHELSQPMSHRYEVHRILKDARRARWNTIVRHVVGSRHRLSRAAAIAEA